MFSALVILLALATTGAVAQEPPLPTRNINVNNHAMRVWSEGLERRKPGQPVVILEGGVPGGLELWRPVFADIARLGPVLAYDRSGLGKSEFDGERPTVQHVATTLHALLDAAHIPPPYVLVGVSWGGIQIRGFASLYPTETVGLVYLDVTDYERTAEEVAIVIPASGRPATPAPLQLPAVTPPGTRAALEQVREYGSTEFAEIKALHVPSVPVAVLVGGTPPGPLPPNALTTNVNILRLMQIRHQAEWALSSPAGLLLVSTQAGHNVVQDVPALVLQAVKHVLDHIAVAPAATGAGAATPPAASTDAPVRVGSVQPPQKTKDVPPVYPPIAAASHVQGSVIVEVTIGPDGKVQDARVLRSIPLLDQAALDAVRQWEYTPTLLNGKPVPVRITAAVKFSP
jgi:TonB family protein